MANDASDRDELEFHYVKSSFFRVINVDGGIGGPSPNGTMIHMAIFSERAPIPQKVVYKLEAGGTLGAEIQDQRVGRQGIFRELEADLVLSVEAARTLRAWLDAQLNAIGDISESKAK